MTEELKPLPEEEVLEIGADIVEGEEDGEETEDDSTNPTTPRPVKP